MKYFIEKCKALLQWFFELERMEHRHWCDVEINGKYNTCEHRNICWMCRGIHCKHMTRKNCKECVMKKKRETFLDSSF